VCSSDLENDTVTLRDCDSMQQERVAVKDLVAMLSKKLAR